MNDLCEHLCRVQPWEQVLLVLLVNYSPTSEEMSAGARLPWLPDSCRGRCGGQGKQGFQLEKDDLLLSNMCPRSIGFS